MCKASIQRGYLENMPGGGNVVKEMFIGYVY